MPFCPKCGRDVLATDKFCLNCGTNLERTGTATAAHSPTPVPQGLPPSTAPDQKNPWGAALMNFFLPGLGYVYIGMGRDGKTLFFGLLILLAVALTFYVGVIGDAISPRDIPSLPAWEETFGLLGLLTPIAFAYDGYHRAQSA